MASVTDIFNDNKTIEKVFGDTEAFYNSLVPLPPQIMMFVMF